MSDDVIKQFVVGLGWKVDQQGQKKVVEAVEGITKTVGTLVVALEAAALAAAFAVSKIAASFDNLYFVSQRTGASVQNLKGLSYAFSQVGSSGANAQGAVESFAQALRTNPAIGGFVRQLGVATEQGGKARDTIDVLKDSIDKIQKKNPYETGFRYAGLLGITEADYYTLTVHRKEIEEFQAAYDKTSKAIGLDNKAAAKSSNEFMTSLRSLQATVTAVAEKIGTDLLPALDQFLKDIRAWIEAHPNEIRDAIIAISAAFMALMAAAKNLVIWLTPVYKAFEHIAESLTGDKGLQASMELFAAFLIGKWVVKILGGFAAVGGGWGALLLRLGVPAAIALAASGGGHETPEGYKAALAGDPARAKADAELNAQGGSGKRWWKRNMPTWLGGEGGSKNAGTGIGRRGARAAAADKTNYNFTGENADVLRQAAKELGTSPEDLATVISYESKFSPKVHGGTGGRYQGLIQFGGPERAQFGANDQQTFKEQMPAVVRYLKTRGFKPGMGLLDLYSTINAGSPGHYDASDGHGTVRTHVAKMQRDEAARVQRFLASGNKTPDAAPKTNFPSLPPMVGGSIHLNPGAAAQALGSSTVNNGGANVEMNHNTKIEIHGSSDPATTGAHVEKAMNRGYNKSLADVQSSVR